MKISSFIFAVGDYWKSNIAIGKSFANKRILFATNKGRSRFRYGLSERDIAQSIDLVILRTLVIFIFIYSGHRLLQSHLCPRPDHPLPPRIVAIHLCNLLYRQGTSAW